MTATRLIRAYRLQLVRAASPRLLPLALLAAACTATDPVTHPGRDPGVRTGLVVSRLDARPGDSVVVAVRADTLSGPLAGLQGRLEFNPARLEYLGQVPTPATSVDLLNLQDAALGRIGIVSYHGTTLPAQTAVLVFAVRHPGFAEGLRYQLDVAATRDLQAVTRGSVAGMSEDRALPSAGLARRLSLDGWNQLLAADAGLPVGTFSPGQYVQDLRFGDVTLDGTLNVFDASYLANVAVGNNPLIAGTDAPSRDAVVAGNVWPFNLPGLGGLGDGLAPGIEAGERRSLSVLDVAAVAREAVGLDQQVVGELIPGREAAPGTRVQVTGTLSGAVTWQKGAIYSLQGAVTVPSGATLTVEPGVRIEGPSDASGLVIEPGARLEVRGTALDPVTLACVAPTGCAGFAISWRGNAATVPGEDAGLVRYLRIEGFGVGFSVTDVGSGTLLDYVQVAGRPGQPISAALGIVGGGLGLRHLVLGPEIAGPAITYTGWSGKGQFLLMRPRVVAGGWLLHAILPSATPPQLYNVTVASQPGSAAAGFPQFSAGGNGVMRNALFYQTGNALQLQDAATCDEILAGRLDITHSLFLALTSPGNPDIDPAPCGSYLSPDVEAQFLQEAARGNRYLSNAASAAAELAAPDEPTLWDLRPMPGSLATTGGATPPNDGFFDPAATYVGAVAPALATGSGAEVPWYAGWILAHAAGASPALPAGVYGTVSSPLAGPLAGVTVTAGGISAVTDSIGGYTIFGFTAGPVSVALGSLPAHCTDPGPQPATTTPGDGTLVDITVTCVASVGTVVGLVTSPELGPLAGVTVTLTPGGGGATGATGAYSIGGVPAGPVTVTLSGLPTFCAPASQGITVPGGGTVTVDFSVSCPPPAGDPALLLLTYICENTFRVRNPNYVAMPVTWDVFGTAESGSLVLPARTGAVPYTETFFSTTATGTVRLFHHGSQIQVKANGGFVCAATGPNQALDFSGAVLEVADTAHLDLSASWTIELWVHPRGAGILGTQELMGKWNSLPNAAYVLQLDPAGHAVARTGNGMIQSALTSTAPLPNGQWTHVAASYSGGTLSLYINGVLDGTLSGAVQPQNSSRPLSWGQESGARVYDGLLDEARAWHVARSGAELLGAMHQRLSGAQPGLVGYWRFDDGTGQAAHDASIHASDGILGQLPLPDVADPTWTTNAAPTP